MLKKGTHIKTVSGEYIVQKQIKQGGNGTIFQVVDDAGNILALKAINRTKTTNDKLKRFRNETAFCENANHPRIVSVLDMGTFISDTTDLIFYIMPYYPHTLRDLIHAGISGEQALTLFSEILEGLQYAHQKKVWHRDIKPENILIDQQCHVVIADFGIAHFCADEMATFVETSAHDRMANFQYAAPEQRNRDQKVDGRADVYALGLILNEMFTKTIISGVNYRTIANVNEEYGYLDGVVSKLICQNPNDRLYPVDKIAIEILSLQKTAENEAALRRLAEEQPVNDLEVGIIEIPEIISIAFVDGFLELTIKGLPPNKLLWFSFLQNGKYSHSAISRYDTNSLRFFDPNRIAIPFDRSDAQLMKEVVQYIKSWMEPATKLYNQRIRELNMEYRKEEKKRIEEEIQKRRINNMLNEMLRNME